MKALLREQMTLARECSPQFLWIAVFLVAVYFPHSVIALGLSTVAYLFFAYLENQERPFWGQVRAGVLVTAAAASLFFPGWQSELVFVGFNLLRVLDAYFELGGVKPLERLARSTSSAATIHYMVAFFFLKR